MMIQQQGAKVGLPLMNLLRFNRIPILQQLLLEEKLLRKSSDNWCIINDGTDTPAIVMGISGKPSKLLEIGSVLRDQVPVIKRFTGGGTVFVDNGTVFVTLICNKNDVPGVQPYPHSIISWSGILYDQVFKGIGDFQLLENVGNMAYLKQPARAPKYRMERGHTEFICRMKEYLPRSDFIEKTTEAIENYFTVKHVNFEATEESCGAEFVPSTRLLTKQELEEAWGHRPEIIGASV